MQIPYAESMNENNDTLKTAPCFFCGKLVDADGFFCYGCHEVICDECPDPERDPCPDPERDPGGEHRPQDHQEED